MQPSYVNSGCKGILSSSSLYIIINIMASPRVAVIGGGISGTLCSLVLQHRGVIPTVIDQGRRVGGRLSLGGAQILRAADPRLAAVYETFCQENLLQSYDRLDRLGVLGEGSGEKDMLAMETLAPLLRQLRRIEEAARAT